MTALKQDVTCFESSFHGIISLVTCVNDYVTAYYVCDRFRLQSWTYASQMIQGWLEHHTKTNYSVVWNWSPNKISILTIPPSLGKPSKYSEICQCWPPVVPFKCDQLRGNGIKKCNTVFASVTYQITTLSLYI